MAAKLIAYGVEISSVRLIYDNLINRRLRTKFGNKYSLWKDILLGVPQASDLGLLLFNIYICDLFRLVNDIGIASYADDTTPYDSGNKISTVVASLESLANLVFNWFTDNQMKENEDKCYVLLSTDEKLQVKIGAALINSSKYEKLCQN